MNIIQCIYAFADREFTLDTIETVPNARKLYSTALDLLKVPALEIKSNLCVSNAKNCLRTQIPAVFIDPAWGNQAERLQNHLADIGDPVMIDSLADDIAALFASSTEETMGGIFAAAFELIETEIPTPPTPEVVSDFIVGYETTINEAYSYMSALNDPNKFNSGVGEMYKIAVAGISGLTLEEVSSDDFVSRIAWLQDPIPDNTTSFKFQFATDEGVQFLTNDLSYNPLMPSRIAHDANFHHSNAPSVIGPYQIGMPVSYTPVFNFNFCTPQNPVYSSLILKGNLELFKIFNCRNIAGMVRELDVFTSATDSVTGVPVIGGNGNLVLPGLNNFAPSQYRFRVLIERAKQIAAQAQQMESLFLSAMEKEDAENYNQLRAKQDLETAKATIKLQDLRINQANSELNLSDMQLDKVTFMQNHFDDLIAAGENEFEKNSLDLLKQSIKFQEAAAALYTSQGIIFAGGEVTAVQSLGSFGQAAGSISSILSIQSSIASQMASFARREQEWEFQRDLSGYDISIANQQIKIADDNIRIVTQEREIAQINADHAQSSLDFLQNKFTNAELYNWMGNVLEKSYSYMLNLSTAIARTAESQLYFERQEQAGPFILDDYWETPTGITAGSATTTTDRRGLTGSARLLVDITRLDQFAFETVKRKLQMTKVISLAQNFPSEFQKFKETGVLNFELTNQLFDYDFPGNYLRLINSVKTTVVGLLPVYDSIKATLTSSTVSYTVIGGTTFQKIPIRRMELDSVALTSPNNSTGLFEMQPTQNELLNPFEGMGVESHWEFKMPQFSNRFDYDNIADVLLTVEYTALDNYQYRLKVLQDLENTLLFNRGFSFKNNFPDQWYELSEVQTVPTEFSVVFELKREMFPQGIDNLELNGNITLYFVRDNSFTSEIKDVDIRLASIPISSPGLETVDGILPTGPLMATLTTSPLVNLRLIFKNNFANRDLFTKGQVKDILLIVGCKAELRNYPL
jgi:hypothetical protein